MTGDASGNSTETGGLSDLAGGVDGKDGASVDASDGPRLEAGADSADGNGGADGAGDGGLGGDGAGGTGGAGGAGGRDGGTDLGSPSTDGSGSDGRDARADLVADTSTGGSDATDGQANLTDGQSHDVVDAPASGTEVPPASDGARLDGSDGAADSVVAGLDGGPSDVPAATCPAASFAKQFAVTSLNGMAVDGTGNQYIAATLYGTVDFGTGNLTSAGGADLALAKLDPTNGSAIWAKTFAGSASAESSGSADQSAAGVAVGHSGQVGAIGTFVGNLVVNGTTTIAGSSNPIDFVMATDNSGNGLWGKSVNTQAGALAAIAGNPARDEFVVCGYAAGGVTDLGLPGTYNGDGLPDIVIAKLNATTGAVIWARQIGGAGSQFCTAVALDAAGTAYATGTYNGTLDLGTGLLPDGGTTTYSSSVLAAWVAEMDSTDGHTLVAKSYSDNIGKQAVRGIAVDGSGNVAVTGNLRNHVAFGGATLTSAGGTDGFLAKLKGSDLTALWARNWGDSGNQEAHGVAFNSAGDIVVVGFLQGSATGLSSATLTSAGMSDAYWAKFRGTDGTSVCAANYGDGLGQVADIVAISSAATGAQRDMVNLAGYSTGTITFAVNISLTSAVSNGFVLQVTP